MMARPMADRAREAGAYSVRRGMRQAGK